MGRAELTITFQPTTPELHHKDGAHDPAPPATITVPWSPRVQRRSREILMPQSGLPSQSSKDALRRTRLVRSIALGRRWLQEVVDGSVTPEIIAQRESCSGRSVMQTISMAFLAPDLVKAAVEGRLPKSIGFARLTESPMEWSQQRMRLSL